MNTNDLHDDQAVSVGSGRWMAIHRHPDDLVFATFFQPSDRYRYLLWSILHTDPFIERRNTTELQRKPPSNIG